MAKVHKECENSLWFFLIYFINCKFVEWALLPLYIYTSSHSPQTHPLLDAASRDLPDIVVKRPTGVAEKEEHAALIFMPFQPVTSCNRLVAFLFHSDFFCCTPFHAISGCGVLRMAILIWNLESSAYYRSPFLCHVAAGRAGWSSSYARQCLVASLRVSAHRRKGIIICTQLSIKWSYTTQTSSFCLFSVLKAIIR